jgi:4-amino-4-deoxy-L-arabinose transferase-like glycosyltransferase
MTCTAASYNDRWLIVLATMLAVVVYIFPLTVCTALLDPDEGLHASIAQEMVERGDWLSPHFLGEPFFDKPILYFWCQALSLRLFGMHEAAVRLPGLIFGLLGAITTGLIGRRMFGPSAGWVAGIFYSTMILPVALVQAPTHDVALIPCINLSILFFWLSERSPSKRAEWTYVAAIGFLLGLSILIKGLIGVALVGVTYGLYVLVTRRLTIRVILRGLVAIFLAALLASGWFIAMETKHPGYLQYFFIQRHLLGFTTATQIHGEAPWWYYLPILLGGGLPWIGYLPATLSDTLARRPRKNSVAEKLVMEKSAPEKIDAKNLILDNCHESHNGAMTLLWCWLIGCTVLLSLAHSKLITYIWPVFPSVAVLAAVGWSRLLSGTLMDNAQRRLLSTFFFSSITGPIVLPLVLFAVQKIFVVRFSWYIWLASVLAGLAALAPLIFWKKRQWPAMLCASILSTTVQFVVAIVLVLPPVAETFTARGLAEYFNHLGRLPARLLVAEERLGSLVFYLDPALRSGLKENQIGMIFYDQPTENPPGTIVALSEQRANQADRYPNLIGQPYKTIGGYRLYELRGQGNSRQ